MDPVLPLVLFVLLIGANSIFVAAEFSFVTPDTPPSDVLTLMQARHVELAAVRDRGRIVGIFSLEDLLQVLTPD